jgi:CubicO group peptidase (beta-lactamase class C family)
VPTRARRVVTAQTAFYIASTTRSFTGLAAAIRAQRGVWDLDAPLSRYLTGEYEGNAELVRLLAEHPAASLDARMRC